MSENYVVFIEQPIKMDLLKIVTCKLRGKALSEGIYWDPNQDTVFHLVDKKTGQVRGGCTDRGDLQHVHKSHGYWSEPEGSPARSLSSSQYTVSNKKCGIRGN